MMLLNVETRRLIVECGIAAVNHGLFRQAESIRHSLPCLTDNTHAQNIIDIVMLIGMGDRQTAIERLYNDTSDDAEILRQLV